MAAWARTWQESAFEPTHFFRRLPVQDALGPAFLYYLMVGVAAAGVGLFWRSLFALVTGPAGGPAIGFMPPASAPWLDVASFLFSPIFLAVWIVLVTGVLHASLWVLGGTRSGLRGTFRALCFTNGPALFIVVPVIGAWAGAAWGVVLTVIGLRETHRIETWRALTALFLPLLLTLTLTLALMLAGVLIGGFLLGFGWN